MDYFGENPKNRQRWAIRPSDLRLDLMTGKCTRPYSHWKYLDDPDARQFDGITKRWEHPPAFSLGEALLLSNPAPCQKQNVPAPLTAPLANALHCYAVAPVFHFFCVRAQGTLITQLLAVNQKINKKYVNKFCPPMFFDSFSPLVMGVGRRKQGAVPPLLNLHTWNTANVFFNKHSLCENISTLTNRLSSLLCCLTLSGRGNWGQAHEMA